MQQLSTAKAYRASADLVNRIGTQGPDKRKSINQQLYSDLFPVLEKHSMDYPHKIDLTEAIGDMKQEAEIRIHVDSE